LGRFVFIEMPQQFGIIGYPLGHSFSPAWFTRKFAALGIDATYEAFPLADISGLPGLLVSRPLLRGLSVTIPHKKSVIPYLYGMDDAAREIGAVNCIDIRNGHLKGYNTDVTGFRLSLQPLLRPWHSRALVLGTGGSSRAVAWVLDHLGIPYQNVSRTPGQRTLTYEELTEEMIGEHLVIVNTTPVGQFPLADACPSIPYSGIGSRHLLFDLVYNPAETKFLLLGKERGATVQNGLEMLHLQAEAAWDIWNR